jgi:hypothetical protein
MSRPRLPSWPLAAVVILAGLAGCAVTPEDLRSVDWPAIAGQDLNCPENVVRVGTPLFHDVSGDGKAEAFVTMRCVTAGRPQPEPGQLEVFAGGSDPKNPTRVAVMVRNSDGIVLDGCVLFAGTRVITAGVRNSAPVQRSMRWQNGTPQPETLPATDPTIYSCT